MANLLHCFEYCSVVWNSAADSHLKLLDRAINNIRFFLPDVSINLEVRRKVAGLSHLYKIFHSVSHPLNACLPTPYNVARPTRYALALNDLAFSAIRASSNQYARCFIPFFCKLWNVLPNETIHCPDNESFKSALRTFYTEASWVVSCLIIKWLCAFVFEPSYTSVIKFPVLFYVWGCCLCPLLEWIWACWLMHAIWCLGFHMVLLTFSYVFSFPSNVWLALGPLLGA